MRRAASDRATGGGTPHDRGPDRAIGHGANERAAGAVLRAAVDAYPAGGERTLRADSARPAEGSVGPRGQRDRSAGGADLYVRVREEEDMPPRKGAWQAGSLRYGAMSRGRD